MPTRTRNLRFGRRTGGQRGVLHRVCADGRDGRRRARPRSHRHQRRVAGLRPVKHPVRQHLSGIPAFPAEKKPRLHRVVGIAPAGLDDQVFGALGVVGNVDFDKVERT